MIKNRINEIDLLRFVAAMAVVFFHYAFRGYAADGMSIMPYPSLAPVSKYGFLGVQLFFMISGFVILMSASHGSIQNFTISRMVRLYPAFWACCTITFIVTVAIGAPKYSVSFNQYITNMTMLNGFIGTPSVDGAYWSLFIEIRFYALIAVILAIGKIHRAQELILSWLIISIVLEIYPIWKLRAIFITDYSTYFIAGATCYLIYSKGLSALKSAILGTSLALAIYQSTNQIIFFENHYNTFISKYITATIITSFYIVMTLISLNLTGFMGRKKWLLIGSLTYPLYLIHQNIGYMIFNIAYPSINPHIIFWCTIFLVIIVAYCVHRFVERKLSKPMRVFLESITNSKKHLKILK
ncbi:acyltransferase [Salmonella enterica]|uniref:Acetyltransferase family protein n=3 Tax=Salmonella enterica TaxID=28901 RepID=A0A3S4I8V1_SALER|nr:acyltransferase [Salmonella enterica]EAW1163114.1 acyltransferase [Salmonella enterica subsp. enterica]ECS6415917.1 acyltransferase [Salmonella enterica subsp. diarizonae serovar 50:r:z]ECU8750023.1 acyltransferase [Salmonella enterica subsp. diarizonae str. CFSAN000558]EDQ7377249.1 acyltransferase [Salmonella enterica subsp. diarizonae serovar 35:l,v:z35]EDU0820957.1 acyltransferase [Salmonella enterica subsp. diarizonae serovar 50:k:z]EHN1753051.1 acyltransferase [Salmonella enterica sub